ncbi:MAG: hypothetical protein ACRYG8_26955 [Janthinobacterium lividum]
MSRRTFTAEQDAILLEQRAAGRSWRDIGKLIGTTGKACQYRLARGLGVSDPKPVQVGRSKPRREPEETKEKRDACPPGADISWRTITAGTILDGSSYR